MTASYYDGRNLIYVLVKDFPLWNKYRGRIIRAQWRLAWEALRAWRGEAARARLRGMLAGIIRVPSLLSKRRAVQAARKISDAEVEALLQD